MILDKSQVARDIFDELIKRKNNENIVRIHTKEVHRDIIKNGIGSCSVDRYLRYMRKIGLIEYENPKRTNHFFVIKIKDINYFDYMNACNTLKNMYKKDISLVIKENIKINNIWKIGS